MGNKDRKERKGKVTRGYEDERKERKEKRGEKRGRPTQG